MELLVRNGDYISDGAGGFRRTDERQELLQRVLWKLSIRRGSFPLLPELGSRLYRLTEEKPSRREALARQYVAEALKGETALTVTDVLLSGDGTLRIMLEWRGSPLQVTVGGV